jgi:hypothetical protein
MIIKRRLGSFMALGTMAFAVTQCQPACTPIDTPAAPVETPSPTAPPTTPTTPATPASISFVEFGCDNLSRPNTQPIQLWVEVDRGSTPEDGLTISNGTDTRAWADFETTTTERISWPRTGPFHENNLNESFTATVTQNGQTVYERTFTADDLTGHLCAPALTGGVNAGPSSERLFNMSGNVVAGDEPGECNLWISWATDAADRWDEVDVTFDMASLEGWSQTNIAAAPDEPLPASQVTILGEPAGWIPPALANIPVDHLRLRAWVTWTDFDPINGDTHWQDVVFGNVTGDWSCED